MTHIEQMIQDLCPNGVEWKTLGELGVFENTGVDKKSHDDEQEVTLLNFMDVCRHKYIDASVPTMVVTAPDRKIEQCNVLKDDIFITPSSETIDEIGFAAVIMEDLPNVVYSYHIMRYRLNQPNTTTAKFIRYLFEAPVIRKQILKGAKGLTRFGLSKYQFADIEIPLPPLEIQEKIVECLDKFSALAAELQAELQMRRKQYEYYRTQLLTPHSDCNSADKPDDAQWEWKTLGEVATLSRGKVYSKEYLRDNAGEYPVYSSQTANNGELGRINTYDYDGKYLTWTTDGAYAGTVFRREGKFSITNVCGLISNIDESLSIDFLFYWLNKVAKSYVYQGMGNPKLMSNIMATIKIPIPPLAEQERIVSILDKFEALTTSLSDGIPAEQAAQQKRYEYYRDKLLTFEKRP